MGKLAPMPVDVLLRVEILGHDSAGVLGNTIAPLWNTGVPTRREDHCRSSMDVGQ